MFFFNVNISDIGKTCSIDTVIFLKGMKYNGVFYSNAILD